MYVNQIVLMICFMQHSEVSAQVMPDSIRHRYIAAKTGGEKGKLLTHYFNLIRFEEGFLEQATSLNKYFTERKDEVGQDYVQLAINDLLSRIGDYVIALNEAHRLLGRFEKRKDDYGVMLSNKLISVSLVYSGDYEEGLKYDKITLGWALKLKDKYDIGSAFNNLGTDYTSSGQLDSGLKYSILGVETGRTTNDIASLSTSLGSLAEAYLSFKDYKKARPVLQESLMLAKASGSFLTEAWAYNDFAQLLLETEHPDSAKYYAMLSINVSKTRKYSDQLLRSYGYLSFFYEKQDIPDSAYKYLKLVNSTKDSLINSRKTKEIQAIGFREQIHEQEAEQKLLQERNRLKIYSLLAGLFLFSVIAFILFRNNKQKQATNRILSNTLDNLKATQAQLIQSEKMASLGELTAGIAHEIQNPLNFVNNFSEVSAEMMEEARGKRQKAKENSPEVAELLNDISQNLEKINHHGKRADAIVKGMLQHSQSAKGIKEPTDINALCDEYFRLAYHGVRAKVPTFHAELKTEFDEALSAGDAGIGKVNVVPQDIGRVLLNLYNNAFYAVSAKAKELSEIKTDLSASAEAVREKAEQKNGIGRDNRSVVSTVDNFHPQVSVTTKKKGNQIEITVTDNGNGIPDKLVDKIFQPFFTTKPTGQGTGLGLSLAYDIIKTHGGEINVKNKAGEGAEFIITLPFNHVLP